MDETTDPLRAFLDIWAEARMDVPESVGDAVALATTSRNGTPSVRIVLLRGCDVRGFTFFTNFESRKGEEVLASQHAALCFHWAHRKIQVRVSGNTERVTDDEADRYFASRARDSQLGAWASLQSRPLASRGDLLKRFADFERKFEGQSIPRPPHWSGFRVVPQSIEIWFDQPHRLHDRHLFTRVGESWRHTLLYP